MDEIATFSRWKAFFGFFLMRKKKHPSRVERAKKKEEIIWENQQIEEVLSMSSPRKNQKPLASSESGKEYQLRVKPAMTQRARQ
jgi:hypothetical protein